MRALALGCFHSHVSTQNFRRALTASLDSCAEIKSAPSLECRNSVNDLAEFGGTEVPERDARSQCDQYPCKAQFPKGRADRVGGQLRGDKD